MVEASPRGTYLTIADALRHQLAANDPPAVLPSEATLMAEYRVARTTVRRALKILEAEGLVASKPGVGWQPTAAGMDRRPLLERIMEKVRADKLKPGSKFPSEAALCKDFGMSRTAVRSALAQLEGQGMLEAVPGKGRFLRALPSADLTS